MTFLCIKLQRKTKWYYACDSSGPIHRSTDTRHGGMTASGFAFADWDLQHLRSIPVVDWIVWTYLDLDHLWSDPGIVLWLHIFSTWCLLCVAFWWVHHIRMTGVSKRQQYWEHYKLKEDKLVIHMCLNLWFPFSHTHDMNSGASLQAIGWRFRCDRSWNRIICFPTAPKTGFIERFDGEAYRTLT